MDAALALVPARHRRPVRLRRWQRVGRQPLPDEGGRLADLIRAGCLALRHLRPVARVERSETRGIERYHTHRTRIALRSIQATAQKNPPQVSPRRVLFMIIVMRRFPSLADLAATYSSKP